MYKLYKLGIIQNKGIDSLVEMGFSISIVCIMPPCRPVRKRSPAASSASCSWGQARLRPSAAAPPAPGVRPAPPHVAPCSPEGSPRSPTHRSAQTWRHQNAFNVFKKQHLLRVCGAFSDMSWFHQAFRVTSAQWAHKSDSVTYSDMKPTCWTAITLTQRAACLKEFTCNKVVAVSRFPQRQACISGVLP